MGTFKVGDIAIAKKDLPMCGIKQGDERRVRSICTCPKCGCESIDVGVRDSFPVQCNCGTIISKNGVWLLDSMLFDKSAKASHSSGEPYVVLKPKEILKDLKIIAN